MNEPLINNIEQLARQSAPAIFQEMLGIALTPDEPNPLPAGPEGQIVSSVGFIGQANGIIHVYAGLGFARVVASKMLGLAPEEVEGDEMVNDAMGELSNVLVGKIKSCLCDAGRSCTLTVPSIVRGQQLSVGEISETAFRILGFKDGSHRLLVEVVVKESQS